MFGSKRNHMKAKKNGGPAETIRARKIWETTRSEGD